jgi:hypothetical protein
MENSCPNGCCALCGVDLPRGVRVAFFASPESDEPVLGDFCSVAHAFGVLEDVASAGALPDTLFLGVRVDRADHDEGALASVMAEIARRAVRAAMADEPELMPLSQPPPGSLN